MNGRRHVLGLVTLLIGVSACSMTFDATTLGVEATMASDVGSPAVGQPFKIDKKALYMLWGLTQPGKPSIDKVLASQVTGDAKVADLRVRVRSRWSDILISILTVGLIVPRSVTYEGVVVPGTP